MITAIEYLRRVRHNLTRREEMQEEIARLRSSALPEAIITRADIVQESAAGDRLGRILTDAEARIQEYQQELAQIRRERVQAQEWIDRIDRPLYRQILEQYYLTPVEVTEEVGAGKTKITRLAPQDLSSVASALGKSYIWVRQCHRVAVEAFAAVSGLPLDDE